MTLTVVREYKLQEYVPIRLRREELAEAAAEYLWGHYSKQLAIEWPSPATDGHWRLTNTGWVGYIPYPGGALRLAAKAPLGSVLGMMEYAYGLKQFNVLPDLADFRSLDEFYSTLAMILAQRVLLRARRGLYRSYVGREEELTILRGRFDVAQAVRRPWRVSMPCQYEEHESDNADNRLLAWTLDRIFRRSRCIPHVLPTLRRAHHIMTGAATLHPARPSDCLGRIYNRLNEDYAVLHALSALLLDEVGITHEAGGTRSVPFLVAMAPLYELFVAAWLRAYLPAGYTITAQSQFQIATQGSMTVRPDLLIRDPAGRVEWVLDTKYKVPDSPANDDAYQAAAYAQVTGAPRAALVYPAALQDPFRGNVGTTEVLSATFAITGDLDEQGFNFASELQLAPRALHRSR